MSRRTYLRHSTRLQVTGNDESDPDEDAQNARAAGTYLPANTLLLTAHAGLGGLVGGLDDLGSLHDEADDPPENGGACVFRVCCVCVVLHAALTRCVLGVTSGLVKTAARLRVRIGMVQCSSLVSVVWCSCSVVSV